MYKLIEFIRRIYVVLLFLVIQATALYVYSSSTHYTQAKLIANASNVTGGVQSIIADIRHYFMLDDQNEILARRVAELENELDIYRQREAVSSEHENALASLDDSAKEELQHYEYMVARVISNSVHHTRNFVTLNKGTWQGVTPNMGVATPDGCIVGHVVACSENYSVVMPLLNVDFRGIAKLEGDNRAGAISWNGTDPSRVSMNGLPQYAKPEIGEDVLVSGLSHYFPADMRLRVGYVESYRLGKNSTVYNVTVRLATDYSSLDYVVLVRNKNFDEVTELEKSVMNNK